MSKIHYIDSTAKGIFINFTDGFYGFFPCDYQEVVPLGNKIRFGDHVVSTVFIRYINNHRLKSQDEERSAKAREAFGNTIDNLRSERGWSERDLALELLGGDNDTKVESKKSHISRWMSAKIFPNYRSIVRLAEAFDLTPIEFLAEASEEYWELIGDMGGL